MKKIWGFLLIFLVFTPLVPKIFAASKKTLVELEPYRCNKVTDNNLKVAICHAAGQDTTDHFINECVADSAIYGSGNAGHFNEDGTTKAGHEQDFFGTCPTPTPTEIPPTTPPSTCPTHTPRPTCTTDTPTASPTSTNTPTTAPISTLTPEATFTPTVTPTVASQATLTPTLTPENTSTPTLTPTSTPTLTPQSGFTNTPTANPDNSSDNNSNNNSNNSSNNSNNNSGSTSNPLVASVVRSASQVLGVSTNYNPLIEGIKEAFGGAVLGATTDLAQTADTDFRLSKVPTDNVPVPGASLAIPTLDLYQGVYQASRLGQDLLVGQKEVLKTNVAGLTLYYGHNATDVFGRLYQLQPGAQVILGDHDQLTTYTVAQKLYVPSTSNIASLPLDGAKIILATCSVTDPSLRIIITLK